MGYTFSPRTVEARKHLLTELAAGRATSWKTAQDMTATRRFAYNIREALKTAAKFPSRYPELARAEAQFSIHIVGPGLVEARQKTQPHVFETPLQGVVGPTDGFKAVKQVGLTTATQCIDSWQAHLPSSDPLLLQRTQLPTSELLKLYSFCQRNVPKLMMLVGEDHITISLYEAEVATLAAWSPPPAPAGAPEEFDI